MSSDAAVAVLPFAPASAVFPSALFAASVESEDDEPLVQAESEDTATRATAAESVVAKRRDVVRRRSDFVFV